jgi:hypothetical protein
MNVVRAGGVSNYRPRWFMKSTRRRRGDDRWFCGIKKKSTHSRRRSPPPGAPGATPSSRRGSSQPVPPPPSSAAVVRRAASASSRGIRGGFWQSHRAAASWHLPSLDGLLLCSGCYFHAHPCEAVTIGAGPSLLPSPATRGATTDCLRHPFFLAVIAGPYIDRLTKICSISCP